MHNEKAPDTLAHLQLGRLDTGKEKERGKPRKASNIVTAKEERVCTTHCTCVASQSQPRLHKCCVEQLRRLLSHSYS